MPLLISGFGVRRPAEFVKHAKFAIYWRLSQSTAKKLFKSKLHLDNCFVIE